MIEMSGFGSHRVASVNRSELELEWDSRCRISVCDRLNAGVCIIFASSTVTPDSCPEGVASEASYYCHVMYLQVLRHFCIVRSMNTTRESQ